MVAVIRGNWQKVALRLVPLAGLAVFATGLYAVQTAPKPKPKPASPTKPDFAKDVAPVLSQFCAPCHQGADPPGGFDAKLWIKNPTREGAKDRWESVGRMVASKLMPPDGEKPVLEAQRQKLLAWIRDFSAKQTSPSKPGRVTMRRLNRDEYNRATRDLLGVDLHLADEFPSDDVGYGFDNIGDVLSISTLHLERYLDAAEKLANAAIKTPERQTRRFSGETLSGGAAIGDGVRVLSSQGEFSFETRVSKAGSYRLEVLASGDQAGPDPARMSIKLDGRPVQTFDVKNPRRQLTAYALMLDLSVGNHRIAAAFINDYYQPQDPNPANRDRNLYVGSMELDGPMDANDRFGAFQQRFLSVRPTIKDRPTEAQKALAQIARRAWRRPVAEDEVKRLVGIAQTAWREGEPYEGGIRLALQAILVSPHFLFRPEADLGQGGVNGARPLNGVELASRLSFFLWSSIPDDRLLELGENGKLLAPEVLAGEVDRMLADPKADALADGFAAQWLGWRKLDLVSPDPKLYPTFDEGLRHAMREETRRFFLAVLRDGKPIGDFLDGKYAFVNEKLARHYGLSGVAGPEFRRVSLAGTPRAGLLTQASVLTITSNPNRTSPVKRGKWVLENLLGDPPPPPPPNVGVLEINNNVLSAKGVRERLAIHRKSPACASCHVRMDPLGFALENFDPVGGFRTKDGGTTVDASGVLPSGEKFAGAPALLGILSKRKADFARCLTEKLLTYGLGRGLESYDKATVAAIEQKSRANGGTLPSLIKAVVTSPAFLSRSLEMPR